MSESELSWNKFLNPENLKNNLIYLSLFITSFEHFKSRIYELPYNFFADEFDKHGAKKSNKYIDEVESKSKYKIEASLLWFQDMGAINKDDITIYHKIRKHRNDIVHNLTNYLSESEKELNSDLYVELINLFNKIEKWWIVNIEIPTDPSYTDSIPTEKEVESGSIIMLKLMHDIATGSEPEEGYYFNEFNKKNKNA